MVNGTQKKGMNTALKVVLIGCGGLMALTMLVFIGTIAWLAQGPEGGVRLNNDMEEYALIYIEEQGLLEEGESIVAYYDVTISMDSTEAALLTNRRVMYHSGGRNTSILLTEIEDVDHSEETLIGDVIVVTGTSGELLKIEIAPFNQGRVFHEALLRLWKGPAADRE